MLLKVAIKSFVSDNAHEAIVENWSSQLDKLGFIQKRKRLEITKKSIGNYLHNLYNIMYTHIITALAQNLTSWGCVRYCPFKFKFMYVRTQYVLK